MHKSAHDLINKLIAREIETKTAELANTVATFPTAAGEIQTTLAELTALTNAQTELNAVKVFKRG